MGLDPRDDGPDGGDVEPNEHEHVEWDPEADFRDPDADSITIPDVSVPDVRVPDVSAPEVTIPEAETDEFDAPSDLLEAFWAVVIVINGAVLALSVGAMLIGFRGDVRNGGILLLVGIVLSGFAARRYRQLRDGDFSDAEGADGNDDGDRADEHVRDDERGDEDDRVAESGGVDGLVDESDDVDEPAPDGTDGADLAVDGLVSGPSSESTPAETNSTSGLESPTPTRSERTNEDCT